MHTPIELQRLKALTALRILDTAPEAIFDHLTNVAARAFNAPIALISLVDADRQWFKACIGLDARETGRDVAFCDYAIRSGGAMVIPDATQDARFRDNPLVTGAPHIRFYAGAPLTLSTGERLGTLCIIDSHPRSDFNAQDRALLEAMAGSVTAALEMRRDISTFAALERERDRKKELLAQAETIAGLGHWSLDAATRTATWSPQLFKIHGLDPDSPSVGFEATRDTYQPEDRAALKAMVGRALTKGEPFEIQARITRPDGERRQVSTKGSCHFGPDGAVETVFGFVLDVTDLKLADERIRRNEAQLRFLTEHTADVIFRTSPEEDITWVSPSCRWVLGYDPGELVGTTGVALIHPDDVPDVATLRAARFAGLPDPAGHTLQARVRRADGSWIWMQENPTVIRDAAGAPIEIINVMRDVSAQRTLEAELLAARDAAEAAAQVKTDFMANMSHEIRTPLTAILGFTSMLAAQPNLDAKAATCVARVAGAGKALLSIVNDVLDFSKLEAGQFEIRPRQASPTEVLTDTLLMFTPQAEEKGLSLELELHELPASLTLDPDRLRQILLNLISNAVKFTDAGSVKLHARYDRAGARLHIAVQDTGAGLTTDQQATLFKRFSQVDGSSTRQHGGTGLGLAICKGFAEAMGGQIGVRSAPGEGATFFFDISAPMADATVEVCDPVPADFAGLRILVVDDTAPNRDLMRSILESAGAEIFEAGNGPEALRIASLQPVDLLILDIRMPDMSGVDVLREIRVQGGPNCQVPAIAFTADDDLETLYPGHGFSGHARKPIVPHDLFETIESVVPTLESALRQGMLGAA